MTVLLEWWDERRDRNRFLRSIFLSAILCFSLSSASLWIDEGSTAYFAAQGSLTEVWMKVATASSSESQMPGYITFMWGWTRVVGDSEFALRASNLLFVAVFATVLYAARGTQLNLTLFGLAFALSPFVWYNLNEARSTVAMIVFSACAILCLAKWGSSQWPGGKRWLSLSFLFICLGCAVNMLFVFALFSFAVLILVFRKSSGTPMRALLKRTVVPAVALVGLAGYYVSTVLSGAGGVRQTPSVLNLLFVFYEFVGLGGIGPPRDVLRAGGVGGLFTWPVILAAIGLIAGIGLLHLTALQAVLAKREQKLPPIYWFAAGLGIACLVIAAYLQQFRFLGRHFAMFYPFFVAQVAAMAPFMPQGSAIGGKEQRWIRPLAALVVAMIWVASIFNIRLNPAYLRDDYRSAVSLTMNHAESGRAIVWSGDWITAGYYGLRMKGREYPASWKSNREAVLANNLIDEELRSVLSESKPFVLSLFNKPDLFDKSGSIQSYVQSAEAKKVVERRDFCIYVSQ